MSSKNVEVTKESVAQVMISLYGTKHSKRDNDWHVEERKVKAQHDKLSVKEAARVDSKVKSELKGKK